MNGVIDGLLVRLGFKADTEEATKFNETMGGIVRTVGALTVSAIKSTQALAGIYGSVNKIVEVTSKATDEVGLLAGELQIDPEILGRWRAYGEMAGVGADKVSGAFSKISDAMSLAKTQGKGQIFEDAAFLGVDLQIDDSVEENIKKIQERVSELYKQGRGADARALLGNLGLQELTPLLSKTKEEMAELMNTVDDTGFVSKEDAENAREIQKAFASVKLLIADSGRLLESTFGESIVNTSNTFVKLWGDNKDTFEEIANEILDTATEIGGEIFNGLFPEGNTTQENLENIFAWIKDTIDYVDDLAKSFLGLSKSVIALGKELKIFDNIGEGFENMGLFVDWMNESAKDTTEGIQNIKKVYNAGVVKPSDVLDEFTDDNYFVENILAPFTSGLKIAEWSANENDTRRPSELMDDMLPSNWFMDNLTFPARKGMEFGEYLMYGDKSEKNIQDVMSPSKTVSPSEAIPPQPTRSVDESQLKRTGKSQSSVPVPPINITINDKSGNPRNTAKLSKQAVSQAVAQFNQNMSNTG